MRFSLFGRRRTPQEEVWNLHTMFGPYLNFAATEAYKLLRTNIVFSFPDDGKGKVVGITSAVQAEGKSTTSANTAYALAEAGYHVLLLEADLRKPTISSKLSIERNPGLSNLLVARGDYRELIQHCASASKFDIISSGDIPPNPSELLGSDRMAEVIAELKEDYDYIIMDLPPVTVVSDTVAVSKNLDGIIMVVRAGVSDQQMLEEAMRQLSMVNVRLVGFTYRDSDIAGKRYSNNKYSKKYYKYYTEYMKHKQH